MLESKKQDISDLGNLTAEAKLLVSYDRVTMFSE
jgi:hypothetical protein